MAQKDFINPIKIGNYYEYIYFSNNDPLRYSVKITKDTTINGRLWYEYKIVNEPPFNLRYEYYRIDSTTLNVYGLFPRCPDSTGSSLYTGFNLPVGYIWNNCDSNSNFLYSQITDTLMISGFLGDTTTLRRVVRKDTIGDPVDIQIRIIYSEKFGMLQYYASSGAIFGGPYTKTMVGAIIDSVTYGSITLSVNQINSHIPKSYSLNQNYPNPFNPSTKICFDIPKTSLVKLKVYNILGKGVSELVNERLNAGSYETTFNAGQLTNGVYFYIMQADNYSETKKMILVK